MQIDYVTDHMQSTFISGLQFDGNMRKMQVHPINSSSDRRQQSTENRETAQHRIGLVLYGPGSDQDPAAVWPRSGR